MTKTISLTELQNAYSKKDIHEFLEDHLFYFQAKNPISEFLYNIEIQQGLYNFRNGVPTYKLFFVTYQFLDFLKYNTDKIHDGYYSELEELVKDIVCDILWEEVVDNYIINNLYSLLEFLNSEKEWRNYEM